MCFDCCVDRVRRDRFDELGRDSAIDSDHADADAESRGAAHLIFTRDGFRCQYCGERKAMDAETLTAEQTGPFSLRSSKAAEKTAVGGAASAGPGNGRFVAGRDRRRISAAGTHDQRQHRVHHPRCPRAHAPHVWI
jgi:hypothetical protein